MSPPTSPQLFSETNGASQTPLQEMQAKHNQLEQVVRELREHIGTLEADRDQLKRERDTYRKQFYFLVEKYLPEPPPELAISKEEIEEAIASGRDFGLLVKELESEWGLRP